MSERNVAALRRLAIIGARLADDRRAAEPPSHPEVPDPGGVPPPEPDTGRHLAPSAPPRSSLLSGLHDRLPMSVHARLGGAGLTAHHVVVVVAVVVAFLAVAVWWLVSAQPSEVTQLSSVESTSASPGKGDDAGSPADSASPEPKGKVVVDVTGKVRKPGIVSLRQGSRVADAIEAAGGPRSKRVDLRALNLARVLVDGEQIIVGLPDVSGATAPPATGATSTTPGSESPAAPINLNTATLEQLETLPGVGPVTGQAIVDWRTEHGQFTSIDELLEVDGIGEVTLEDLRELVSV